MTCAWKELLAVLPQWMHKDLDTLEGESLQELRLRINSPPELVFSREKRYLKRKITREDLNFTVNTASRYSPWAAVTASRGYITAPGGHRIGLCGEMVVQREAVTGIRSVTSLCIRVARDFPGIAANLKNISGSVLILGPPGWGKTTLLRDLVRQLEGKETICVVDERGELFPEGLTQGEAVDVLAGCSKAEGISMVLRTMGPSCIAVDEITAPEDVVSLMQAGYFGVRLLATAHAVSLSDFRNRRTYQPLIEDRIFDTILVLKKDKSYTLERMTEWITSGLVRY